MSFPKLPLLVGLISVSGLTAQAQTGRVANAPTPGAPASNFTAVDANGNLVRAPRPDANSLGASATPGSVASNDRSRRGRDSNRGGNDSVRYGTTYYLPGNPYYPGAYPGYPAPTYNNYYYPAQPSTTIIAPPALPWARPATITSIPLGGTYGGYGAPAYPGYGAPAYPSYPAQGYGYPAPSYGYPAAGYNYPAPGYGYPAYGYPVYPGYPTYGNTTIYSNGSGGIYSQSQTSGYGVSLGNGGLSIQLGNRKTTSSTTVTRY